MPGSLPDSGGIQLVEEINATILKCCELVRNENPPCTHLRIPPVTKGRSIETRSERRWNIN